MANHLAGSSGTGLRAIIVAEQPVQANALSLLLSTDPEIDVVGAECYVERARASILRHRPDVVVIRSSDPHLCRFNRLLDLRLAIPDLGFVVIPAAGGRGTARRAPVDRAVVVLSPQFSLDELLASARLVAGRDAADHDREYMSVPIAI